jgi:methyl-accepting chemotaxis protein
MTSYRRRIYLVDKKFQFRIAFYVCTWLIGLSFLYPLVVQNIFDFFIGFASTNPIGTDLELIEQTRRDVLTLIVLTQVIFIILTFISSILLAHRIVGPIFKLRKFMENAKAGNLSEELSFRKYDHFKYLSDDYNQLIQSFRERLDQAAAQIEKAMPEASPGARQELEKALITLRQGH